jgi:hypothetical protein
VTKATATVAKMIESLAESAHGKATDMEFDEL